ncbi:nucleotide exchange factor GrpE [Marinicellulosiphila megalodicopiae]|uniref:nucleotide exchange factor GrpE n=1 Tax=Marinicellulosiphila megalodicopiae TaxID=2724896 RepID=UPI003BB01ED2
MSVDEKPSHDELEEVSIDEIEQEEQAQEGEVLEADNEVELLKAEAEKWKEAALRSEADSQNTRRRAEIDVQNAHKFGVEKLIKELLPVIDNLDRALESADTENESLKPMTEGVELTLKSFVSALEKFEVVAIDPVGEPFDPKLHQAMTMIEQPDAEPNSVIAVMQKGYEMHGRLIRPAMVVVNKG